MDRRARSESALSDQSIIQTLNTIPISRPICSQRVTDTLPVIESKYSLAPTRQTVFQIATKWVFCTLCLDSVGKTSIELHLLLLRFDGRGKLRYVNRSYKHSLQNISSSALSAWCSEFRPINDPICYSVNPCTVYDLDRSLRATPLQAYTKITDFFDFLSLRIEGEPAYLSRNAYPEPPVVAGIARIIRREHNGDARRQLEAFGRHPSSFTASI